jgi:hypothetical protein
MCGEAHLSDYPLRTAVSELQLPQTNDPANLWGSHAIKPMETHQFTRRRLQHQRSHLLHSNFAVDRGRTSSSGIVIGILDLFTNKKIRLSLFLGHQVGIRVQ